jgi:hypothetical protein
MFLTFADSPANADIAYLTSAFIRDAMIEKFNTLFGQKPASKGADEPMSVKETRVPSMISESVDHEIAGMLLASAVEHSKSVSGDLPEIAQTTLLYTVLDDDPASVALESVPEFQQMDKAASDSTISAINEHQEITIKDGMCYLPKELSTIEIGVYADNQTFAKEFQYRLQNMGGTQIGEKEKLKVFDDIFNSLPGGDSLVESDARTNLLKVVGLTSALTPSQKTPEQMKAPGPQPEPETVEK